MTDATLTLIRHGQTDWNARRKLQGRTDIPLNATGKDQARAVGEQLAASGRRWDVLVSSPLSRARETAEIIGSCIGLPLERTYEDLVERSFGDIEGHDCTGMSDEQRHAFMEHHGEPAEHLVSRGLAVLQEIVADHPGQDVMVVSHGTFIRLTAGHVLNEVLHSLHNGEVVTVPVAQLLAAEEAEASG